MLSLASFLLVAVDLALPDLLSRGQHLQHLAMQGMHLQETLMGFFFFFCGLKSLARPMMSQNVPECPRMSQLLWTIVLGF